MKKIIVLFIAFCFSYSVRAQIYFKAGIVQSDLNVNASKILKVNGRELEQIHEGDLSYTLGVGYHIRVFNSFGIEVGGALTKLRYEDVNINEASLDLNYVTLPVQAKFKIKKVELGVGVAPAVLVNFEELPLGYKDHDGWESKIDISGMLTASYFPLEGIGIELGYNYGFIPITEFSLRDVNGNVVGNQISKNRFYNLSLVIRI